MGVLRFRVFGVPTEVQPGFWILPLYLGARYDPTLAGVLMIVAVVLVSLLVHEMGHAVVARAFGQAPRIRLHMLGGTTSWEASTSLSRLRHGIVSLAGPFAGFALGFVAILVQLALAGESRVGDTGEVTATGFERALWVLIWVNFVWGAINLLPVLPFDGGQVLSAALGPERRRMTSVLSLMFGVGVALVMLVYGWVLGAILFFVGGVANFVATERSVSASARPEALAQAMERARAALDAGEYPQAAAIARAVLDAAGDGAIRIEAIETIGWAALLAGDTRSASEAVAAGGTEVDAFLQGAVYEAVGDPRRAAEVLSAARHDGDQRPQLAGLLVKVLLAAERWEDATRMAVEILNEADEDETRRVAVEAFEGGAHAGAGRLWRAVFDRTSDPTDAYDAARAFARAGERERALESLGAAVAAGHGDLESARADEDLAALRGDARFEALLSKGASEGA